MNKKDCIETNCPVHFRNDESQLGDSPDPWIITYVNEYAVHSYMEPGDDRDSASVAQALNYVAALQAGDFSKIDEVADFLRNLPRVPAAAVYIVGYGAISDVMSDPAMVDVYQGNEGETLESLHAHCVQKCQEKSAENKRGM